jgi:hypothetical protein
MAQCSAESRVAWSAEDAQLVVSPVVFALSQSDDDWRVVLDGEVGRYSASWLGASVSVSLEHSLSLRSWHCHSCQVLGP